MPSVTLEELESSVYAQLDGNVLFYTEPEVRAAINDAVRALNLYTGMLQSTLTVAGGTVAGRQIYDVPQGILYPLGVYVNSRQLDRSTLRAIGMRYRRWTEHTTANFGRMSDWIPLGITKFAVHPVDVVGGRTLQVVGVVEPAELVNGSDVINCPDTFASTVEDLASHTLQLKEGGKIFSDASVGYQAFLATAKNLMRWRTMKQPRYWIETEQVKMG